MLSQLEQSCKYFGKTNANKPITTNSSAKKALLVDITGRNKIYLDRSKNLSSEVKQHNLSSESITSQETSLAIKNTEAK